jgi:hypothetical protein
MKHAYCELAFVVKKVGVLKLIFISVIIKCSEDLIGEVCLNGLNINARYYHSLENF